MHSPREAWVELFFGLSLVIKIIAFPPMGKITKQWSGMERVRVVVLCDMFKGCTWADHRIWRKQSHLERPLIYKTLSPIRVAHTLMGCLHFYFGQMRECSIYWKENIWKMGWIMKQNQVADFEMFIRYWIKMSEKHMILETSKCKCQ